MIRQPDPDDLIAMIYVSIAAIFLDRSLDHVGNQAANAIPIWLALQQGAVGRSELNVIVTGCLLDAFVADPYKKLVSTSKNVVVE